MKLKIYSIFFILFLSTFAQAKNKIVSTPIYVQNDKMFRIDTIEITEKTTILHCVIRTLTPTTSTVTISSQCHLKGETGKRYDLLNNEGISLNEKIHSLQPLKFILKFEPLDENEKMFHLLLNSDEQTEPVLSYIHTYKPENVQPFKCKIKGKIIDLPECKRVMFYPNAFRRTADTEYIPVINGEFEFEKEYNFIELYNICPEEENPINPKGQFSGFYIQEGTINVTLYSKESGIPNEISGNLEDRIPYKLLFGADTVVYEQYYNIVDEKIKYDDGIVFIPAIYSYHHERNAISEKYITQVDALNSQIQSNRLASVKDSLLTVLIKIQQKPDFYSKKTRSLIKKMEITDKKNMKTLIRYYSENPNVVNFYDLKTKITGLLNHYPAVYKYKYGVYQNNTYINNHLFYAPKNEADAALNQYIELFENVYKPLMLYHPECIELLQWISTHNKRMEQVELFFDACSRINLTPNFTGTIENKSQTYHFLTDINAYEQLEKNIATALQKKDSESIRFITEFEKDYMSKYPDHEITKRIKKMIQITTDEQNPNKWRQTLRLINFESLIDVLKTIQQNQQQ